MKKATVSNKRGSLVSAGVLAGALLSMASLVSAEVIQIPVGSQGAATLSRPALGMLKDRVIAEYGEPAQRHPAVGQPPIERWDYDQFSVYFEYDHVVHSVLKGPKPPE